MYLGWDAGTLNNTLPRGQTGTCNDKTVELLQRGGNNDTLEDHDQPQDRPSARQCRRFLKSVFIVNIPEWQLSTPSRPSVHEVEELLKQVAHACQHHPW